MAIGNYWECVLPAGTDMPPLQQILSGTTMLAQQRLRSWRFEPDGPDSGGADFAFMATPSGDMRAVVHLIKPHGRPRFYLHSAFPWLAAGAPALLRLRELYTNHFGVEGFVAACLTAGPAVSFFDPLFALNKEKYTVGTEHRFMLGAVSLDLALVAAGNMGFGPDDVKLDSSRARMLARAAEDAPDYYLFRGSVQMVRSAAFLERPFLVFRTAVVGLDREDLAIDIYVDRSRFLSRPIPTAGDIVCGSFWLQGCLVESSAG